jgi:hypothetical protein
MMTQNNRINQDEKFKPEGTLYPMELLQRVNNQLIEQYLSELAVVRKAKLAREVEPLFTPKLT